jgi:translation initiation factor 5B
VSFLRNPIEIARAGREVCIKIDTTGDKKLLGRHFTIEDDLISRISRQSIDAVRSYFKEDLTKPDWKLMLKLKKKFDII